MSISNIIGPLIVFGLAGSGVGVGMWTRSVPETDVSTVPNPTSPTPSASYQRPDSVKDITETCGACFVSTDVDPFERQFLRILPAVAKPLHFAELTPPTDGPLDVLYIQEGEYVEDNTLLALIDNRIALASVAAAEAATHRNAMLAAARAKEDLARQYLQRIEQAAEKNAASGLEIDEAKGRLTEAIARVAEGEEQLYEANARLLLEKARLASHEIRAPFAGTIVRIRKHEGETLVRGESLFAIADLSRLRSDLNLPANIASQLQVGDVLTVVAELNGRPNRSAVVSFIAPMIDAATETIRVQIEIDNICDPLPAGFSVRIEQSAIQAVLRDNKKLVVHRHSPAPL